MLEGRRWMGIVAIVLAVTRPAAAEDGAALFASHCAACHGDDARGREGRPDIHCHRSIAGAVRQGRTGAAGAMPPFAELTDAEVEQLQQHLRELCPSPGGAGLYVAHCAGCHGPDGAGTVRAPTVQCAVRVRDAVRRGRDTAMPPLPGMSDVEVDEVQAYLADVCAKRGRTVRDVYAANCATCHGRDGAGGRDARWIEGPDIRCTAPADFTQAVVQGQGGMPAFRELGPLVESLRRQARGRFRCPAAGRTP
jgi:mono/diheme cytochrome c family protein